MFFRVLIRRVLILVVFAGAQGFCECINCEDSLQLDNGFFECCDPNLSFYNINPPICWKRILHPESNILNDADPNDCFASVVSYFEAPETRWIIEVPDEGKTFVVLSSGGFDYIEDSDIKGAILSQTVFLSAGDIIFGSYFFGTKDYSPYNDYGEISFVLRDPNIYPDSVVAFSIPESRCDVETVESFRSTLEMSPETHGWIPFTYVVEPNNVGDYFIQCKVVDEIDAIYPSYYAVDNLRICKGGKPLADLNNDCDVNLEDFSIISEAWMLFCPETGMYDPNMFDPNMINSDPNIPCQLADIDKSWYVDPNDLLFLSDEWLYNK